MYRRVCARVPALCLRERIAKDVQERKGEIGPMEQAIPHTPLSSGGKYVPPKMGYRLCGSSQTFCNGIKEHECEKLLHC